MSGAAFRILSGAGAVAPDEIYVEFFRAVPPAGQGRSRARIPPVPRAARRIISTTRLAGTREVPGGPERTNWTACEAPARHQGGRKGPIGQPARHQGDTREAGKDHLDSLLVPPRVPP